MRVLVPVDGSSQSINAVRFLAERHVLGEGDEIELINVQKRLPQSIEKYLGEEAVSKYYDEEAGNIRRELEKAKKDDGFNPDFKVLFGDAIDVIAEEAEAYDPDLIIMGARGQRALTGLLFGSVSRGVLAKVQRPLLILRDREPGVGRPLRVGVACDGSEQSLKALRHAISHRQLYGSGCEWHLIYVASGDDPDKEFAERTQEARAELGKVAIFPKEIALTGNPGIAVSKYVDSAELDLLIMGSHGYGNMKTLILGSVAAKIAAESDVPLLIIH